MIQICIFLFWCSMFFYILPFFLYQWFKYNISLLFEEVAMKTIAYSRPTCAACVARLEDVTGRYLVIEKKKEKKKKNTSSIEMSMA